MLHANNCSERNTPATKTICHKNSLGGRHCLVKHNELNFIQITYSNLF